MTKLLKLAATGAAMFMLTAPAYACPNGWSGSPCRPGLGNGAGGGGVKKGQGVKEIKKGQTGRVRYNPKSPSLPPPPPPSCARKKSRSGTSVPKPC
jgi:hypothetical protein